MTETESVQEMEAVRGERGYWHATLGDWHENGGLRTLCGRGIGPHYRRFTRKGVLAVVNCAPCSIRVRDKRRRRVRSGDTHNGN